MRPQPPEKQGSPVRLAWVPPSRAAVPLGLSCTEALCSRGLAGQPGPSTEDNITQPLKPRPRKTPGRWEAFRLVLSGESGQDCRNPLPEGLAEAQGSGRVSKGQGWTWVWPGWPGAAGPGLFYHPLRKVEGPTLGTLGPSHSCPRRPPPSQPSRLCPSPRPTGAADLACTLSSICKQFVRMGGGSGMPSPAPELERLGAPHCPPRGHRQLLGCPQESLLPEGGASTLKPGCASESWGPPNMPTPAPRGRVSRIPCRRGWDGPTSARPPQPTLAGAGEREAGPGERPGTGAEVAPGGEGGSRAFVPPLCKLGTRGPSGGVSSLSGLAWDRPQTWSQPR